MARPEIGRNRMKNDQQRSVLIELTDNADGKILVEIWGFLAAMRYNSYREKGEAERDSYL